jgi:hypothetical protein
MLCPRGESPFVLRDSKVDFVAKQLIIESTDNGFPGLFLIQEAGIDDATYQLAKRNLDGSNVAAIVRRTSKETMTAWDMNGHQISTKDANIPANILESLKPDQLAIKMTRMIPNRIAQLEDFKCQFAWSLDNRPMSSRDSWGVIACPSYQFADVLLQIHGEFIVGEFSAQERTQHIIDEIRFQVIDNKKAINNVHNDSLRVLQLDHKQRYNYYLHVNFDRDLFLKSFPEAPNSNLSVVCSMPLAVSSDTPKGATEIFLSCNQAIAFWKSISVVRKVQLNGYISRIPTQPRSTK